MMTCMVVYLCGGSRNAFTPGSRTIERRRQQSDAGSRSSGCCRQHRRASTFPRDFSLAKFHQLGVFFFLHLSLDSLNLFTIFYQLLLSLVVRFAAESEMSR